jgi:hypothetical protein
VADASEPPREPDVPQDTTDDVPPMLPSRAAFLLAFGAVVFAGILGGIIGFGVADVGSDSSAARLLGTFLGAVIAAAGVGIVSVLVLRAMSEWNRQRR